MMARRYTKDDYEQLLSWMGKRKKRITAFDQLPEYGWIVDGVAAVFLMRTDCSIAFIENFVTNPDASKEDRLMASDLLFIEAEQKAKELGFRILAGYSSIMKVVGLGLRYGCTPNMDPHYLFRKVLGENDFRIPQK